MDPNQPNQNQPQTTPPQQPVDQTQAGYDQQAYAVQQQSFDQQAYTGQVADVTPQQPQAGYGPPAPQPQPQAPYPQAMPNPQSAMPGQQYGAPGQPMPPPPMAPPKNTNPNSTQNTLQIAEIRDGIVIMNDGGFRAVMMTKSINFDLMSTQEREGVEYAFQGFLNSLYFDIQIFIRSQKIDVRPYLDKLVKLRNTQENMLLGLLMEDYIHYVSILAEETNIMDKKFYIVIPYYPSINAHKAVEESKKAVGGLFNRNKQQIVTIDEKVLEEAKSELRNRVQAVSNGLIQMGMNAVALDTKELGELYYDAYNPDTATRQELGNLDSLTSMYVTKGEGEAPMTELGGGGF